MVLSVHTPWQSRLVQSQELCTESRRLRKEAEGLIVESRNLRTVVSLSLSTYQKSKQEWLKLSLSFRLRDTRELLLRASISSSMVSIF
jgi:hypothetical protein